MNYKESIEWLYSFKKYGSKLGLERITFLMKQLNNPQNNLKIIHDNNGGAFILWTEKINNKESLLLKKVDPSGKSVLGKKPIKMEKFVQDYSHYWL